MLKDIKLQTTYDPALESDDVLKSFYIPCLKEANRYDRMSAYFSSGILKKFGEGLEEFVKNNGKIRFIFSCEITQEEMNIITTAYKDKMDKLSERLDDTLKDNFIIANLSYLIQSGIAEVKIAFMLGARSALMHMKSGIFEDEQGNKVCFDGSGNETESGIMYNAEIFHVYTNFDGPNVYVDDCETRFEKIWNNTYSPSTIRTEYPVGKLFDKLTSYSQNRIFNNVTEFYDYKNCVLVDIDIKNNQFILTDFTNERYLKTPMYLKSKLSDRWEEMTDNIYLIKNINIKTIKNTIVNNLSKYNIPFVLSNGILVYLENYDLQIDKRIKLGLAIKNNIIEENWKPDYFDFKKTVDSITLRKLLPKQMENAYYHYQMKSSFDFSVPGTGKTYISYGLYAYLKSRNEINSLVVFGPLNCFKAWKEESVNIIGNLSIFNIADHHNDFEEILKNNKFDVYLFNYDIISDNKIEVLNKYVMNNKTFVVFDEIHKLKSLTGSRANLFIKLFNCLNSKPIYKLALTGTPIPNSYIDIYNYLCLLYENDINDYFYDLNVSNLKKAKEDREIEQNVIDKINPIFVRTTKKDLNIPPANKDIELIAEPIEAEQELFTLIRKAYKNPLVKFIRLIQASSNPSLLSERINASELSSVIDEYSLNDEDLNEYVYTGEIIDCVGKINFSSKTKKTIELIKELVSKGEKVLVWGLFINTINLVKNELLNSGINTITITGSDDVKTREQKIDEFKTGNVSVLITNPNTLAESVSLHKECHNAIYLEYGFNLTYLLQSKDRIHRVGLPEGTETNYYFAQTNSYDDFGSIDKHIYEVLEEKSERMRRAIETNELRVSFDTTDLEDIQEILLKSKL